MLVIILFLGDSMKRYVLLLGVGICMTTLHLTATQETDALSGSIHDQHLPLRKKTNYLEVENLNVTRYLSVNGQQVVANQGSASLAAYGQFSVTNTPIELIEFDQWVPVPFDTVGPFSDVTVSLTSPASFIIQKDGIYQINTYYLLSIQSPDEGAFTISLYRLGISINGGDITEVSIIQARDTTYYLLNYSNLIELSKDDEIQFFISTNAGTAPFINNVLIETGNAFLVKISS